MRKWPSHPVIYEINAWVWLSDLSRKYGRALDFATVPKQEWDTLGSAGFDAIWLMGVWERSPAGIEISTHNEELQDAFRRALPDFEAQDNVGSPYCVRRYVVDNHFGGPAGLAVARGMLRERGLRLILDFVPNHTAMDHPWVTDRPDYFVRGNAEDARTEPTSFFCVEDEVFARGRDPYFPAWPDVLQLNAFHPGLRHSVIETIEEIAGQCDGIRCDMAMLMLNAIFERTWGERAGARPVDDYWISIIRVIKGKWPDFKFIAEAYWDLEWELQQQGFDFCYDKKLYDRLKLGAADSVRLHLLAERLFQDRLVRFIENHDEPRAATAFPSDKGRAVAVVILTLTGAKLLHQGQLEGTTTRLPVFLGRRPAEPADQGLSAFYDRLLKATNRNALRNGEWHLCAQSGWPDNQSCLNILAWCWIDDQERFLIVINFSQEAAQGRVVMPWDDLQGKEWLLTDALSDESYPRSGSEMQQPGLYVDLPPWKSHLFEVRAL